MGERDATAGRPSDLLGDLTPPRIPQQARSRAKRDRLLAAALALFEENGYDATTIDAIAARAGVSVGVFYRYFRSKRQILLTLSMERIEQTRFTLGAAGSERLTIARVITSLDEFLVRSRRYEGLRRARQELVLTDPDFAALDRQTMDGILTTLRENLARLRAFGGLRPELDTFATAAAIFAMVFHLRDMTAHLPERELAAIIAASARVIYHALYADGATETATSTGSASDSTSSALPDPPNGAK
ncbi:MAG: TetR/AcrR family transcriptional regulator [Ktedonobacterales bacterium]